MNNINEKLGLGTAFAGAVGAGIGAAFGAPLLGAAAGVGTAMAAKKLAKKAMSGPPKKPANPKTQPRRVVKELKSFKDFVDEIDFGFTEEEFEVTGDEIYEDWGEVEELEEAEKGGRQVKLGKPFLTPGGPKKRAVYVKHPSTGNTVKVSFGDPNMRIKKSDPERRRSFRARHNCENPGPRHKARYWSCKAW